MTKPSMLYAHFSINKAKEDHIVYKKVEYYPKNIKANNRNIDNRAGYAIVELLLSKDTQFHFTNYKCRAASLKVLKVTHHSVNLYNQIGDRQKFDCKKHVPVSIWNNSYPYVINRVVKPKRPFSRKHIECASGIHFFFTKTDAKNYQL